MSRETESSALRPALLEEAIIRTAESSSRKKKKPSSKKCVDSVDCPFTQEAAVKLTFADRFEATFITTRCTGFFGGCTQTSNKEAIHRTEPLLLAACIKFIKGGRMYPG